MNGAEWLHSLGDVPMERIVFDPWPGLATESDLLLFAERDKRLCELVDGTLVEKPVGFWEGLIAARIVTFLTNFANSNALGAVFGADSPMRMKARRIRMPDASFISVGRLPQTSDPIPNISPDLVVEVLSAANTKKEIQQKLTEYFQSGTRLVWVIDPPTRTAAVYLEAERIASIVEVDGFLSGEPVLPGLHFPMADLFQNIPPVHKDA